MRRYLLVALWPAGLAAIAAATVIAARREPATRTGAADRLSNLAAAKLSETVARATRAGGPGGQHGSAVTRHDWVPGLIRLGAIGGAGGLASYRIMASFAPPVVNHGLAIDEPIFRWTETHQVDWWAAIMERLNRVGNVWTTWGAVGGAAACLGVSWRRQRWLPPAALGLAVVVDHYATSRLHRKIARPGPPTNPLGTYPAGGADRVVLFSGLIAYLLWREFSGSDRGRVCAIGAVAALAFNQAYAREYLSEHWFIDIICGLVYGGLLLAPFIAAVRLIAGPVGIEAGPGGELLP
jgi:PAP2 superfamily